MQFHGVRRDVNSPPMHPRFDHDEPLIGEHSISALDGEHGSYDANHKNVKSSADSGLGSSEVVNEQQQWRNGETLHPCFNSLPSCYNFG